MVDKNPEATTHVEVEASTATVPAGAQVESHQAPAADATAQPGAEAEDKKVAEQPPKSEGDKATGAAKRTITEDEVKEREAKLTSQFQSQMAEIQARLNQTELDRQIALAYETERQAKAGDAQLVEQGQLTQEEANSRAALRIQAAQLQQANEQQEAYLNKLGRVRMAHDLAAEFGIKAEDLLSDAKLNTPLAMWQKASKMALKAKDDTIQQLKAKPESFDKGPSATAPAVSTEEQKQAARYPSMFKKK